MRALATIKPATDRYGAAAAANLFATELPWVRVVNPAIDVDPNTAALSPTDPRVAQWPTFAFFTSANGLSSILGSAAASLQGRFWYYEPALGTWFASGNGFAPVVLVVGAAQGAFFAALRAPKPHYFQTTLVTVGVTDLFYGII
jgi:hypothetical protein